MSKSDGKDMHSAFWSKIISWAASSTLNRLELKPEKAKFEIGKETKFWADVLTDNYITDDNAKVTATLHYPNGKVINSEFFLDPKISGRYISNLIIDQSGEYLITLEADSSGEKLNVKRNFMATESSTESLPLPMAETELKSLAVSTGGEYWHWTDIDKIEEIPLHENNLYNEEKIYWSSTWLFLIAVLLLILPDWYLRRRIGLK